MGGFMQHTLALFGEAEKGQFSQPISISSMSELVDSLGHPPEESEGISCAIQALLHECELIYFRVQEEGFSAKDYFRGLHTLEHIAPQKPIHAICMPGVGDSDIIEASYTLSERHNTLLVTKERDLYDYLTTV